MAARKQKCLAPLSFDLEDSPINAADFDVIIGLDEVGVACLAGPVVAACFAYSPQDEWVKSWTPESTGILVRDSKQLNEKQREESERWFRSTTSGTFAIAEASVGEIDEINIFWAAKLAMKRAFDSVVTQLNLLTDLAPRRCLILVDGNHVPKDFNDLPPNFSARAVVKGDTKLFGVAAASIFAKNYRDRFMKDLSREFPHYSWESNVGYPTPVHQKALGEHGITPWHRRSFRLDYSK